MNRLGIMVVVIQGVNELVVQPGVNIGASYLCDMIIESLLGTAHFVGKAIEFECW